MTTKNKNRAITIDQLPIPQSRAEEFLEFLCYNGVGGGTGGGGLTEAQVKAMIDELLKDATFDEVTNKIILTKENNQMVELDLTPLVEKVKAPKEYEKFVIVAVAGQSNAVGYDESPIDTLTKDKALDNVRIRQLGFKGDDNLKLVPLGPCAQNWQDMTTVQGHPNGTKGVHLPLANLLLPHIPEDYGVLILPLAYGGTGFNSGVEGTYDDVELKPSTDARKWGLDTPFYKCLRDRVKYALDLNPENIFSGVIWIQGENDRANPSAHYTAFQTMTDAFFEFFNTNNYGNRVKKGIWDRDIWFNVETVAYWYKQGQSQAIWDNYRTWNPKTYVEIPRSTHSNFINGTGITSRAKGSHFGNDAFRKVIAPILLNKLLENDMLFMQSVVVNKQTFAHTTHLEAKATVNDLVPYGFNVTINNTGEMVISTDPNGPATVLGIGDVFKVEFEVTKAIYFLAVESDNNGDCTVMALGGAYTHRVVRYNRNSNTFTVIASDKDYTHLHYTFRVGDKVAIYRNIDGAIDFYLCKASVGYYEHWFHFNPADFSGADVTASSITSTSGECKQFFAFMYGITGGEIVAPFNANKRLVHKNMIIQKAPACQNNALLDVMMHNKVKAMLTTTY